MYKVTTKILFQKSIEIKLLIKIKSLIDTNQLTWNEVLRRCIIATLNSGNAIDDTKKLFETFSSFQFYILPQKEGVLLNLENAPSSAFVDKKLIKGIREHIFAVFRDIIFINPSSEFSTSHKKSTERTNLVFHILNNAQIFTPNNEDRNIVVCWGGHSINRAEYEYTKEIGYTLGLRGVEICTGCGPGAMKGPMKGAMIGHAKQRRYNSQYIGITEPYIIGAEPPNAFVNNLVIMPDIEKRLEAFVRIAQAIIIFPGGVGTTEELLYILAIMMNPNNKDQFLPLILTGPQESRSYFHQLNKLIEKSIGIEATRYYKIIIDNPIMVAKEIILGIKKFKKLQKDFSKTPYFNWGLKISKNLQLPFEPTHKKIAQIKLSKDVPQYILSENLRRTLSSIVAGNVKEKYITQVAEKGPYIIHGEKIITEQLNNLLQTFIKEERMKINQDRYKPCYQFSDF